MDSIRSEPTCLLEQRYILKLTKDEYYNYKKEAEIKIKDQNERIIDLMTLLRTAQMGDKDSNDAICQTDISGKIVAYNNVEGIATAAIELNIFNSAITSSTSKPINEDKNKKKLGDKSKMKLKRQGTISNKTENLQSKNTELEDDEGKNLNPIDGSNGSIEEIDEASTEEIGRVESDFVHDKLGKRQEVTATAREGHIK